MTSEQIETLKSLLSEFLSLRKGSKERDEAKTSIITYLAGCLDGIKYK